MVVLVADDDANVDINFLLPAARMTVVVAADDGDMVMIVGLVKTR